MRPIDETFRDALKAASEGIYRMPISRAELRQLKDYELVMGTTNPDVATFVPGAAIMLDGVKTEAPPAFELHVKDTMR
jgi:hypothetical protein